MPPLFSINSPVLFAKTPWVLATPLGGSWEEDDVDEAPTFIAEEDDDDDDDEDMDADAPADASIGFRSSSFLLPAASTVMGTYASGRTMVTGETAAKKRREYLPDCLAHKASLTNSTLPKSTVSSLGPSSP